MDGLRRLRNYSAGTRAALQAHSRGTCYFPACREPIVKLVEGVQPKAYSINYEIAHIRGAQEKGPRHKASISDDERKAFPNLILLCKPHHTYVDKTHPEKYWPETLLAWKAERESGGEDALAGLSGLTEGRLQDVITEAFEAKQDQFLQTLERLEDNDTAAARVMAEILDELDLLRGGPSLNPNTVEILGTAAQSLSSLPNSVDILSAVAHDLSDLPRNADALNMAAGNLEFLPSLVDSLTNLAERLENLRGGWE